MEKVVDQVAACPFICQLALRRMRIAEEGKVETNVEDKNPI
ncbi:uncharacterized protein G2W53_038596 [Senna tora]|uniref:Uncharacterized protein n=1 Tax=Senna tora TaxID=362788 RepID=A0A834W268_9FABA|nr:uncharacterized protein G2W53_038596 [Senna tora]